MHLAGSCSVSQGFRISVKMSQSSVFGNLLNSIFKRKTAQQPLIADEVARALRLEYPLLAPPVPSIHWNHTLNLKQLANLPTNALYGPVQQDKAEAHGYLSKIASIEVQSISAFDMRGLYGLNHEHNSLLLHDSWESMAQAAECRHIRIISMRDFNRVLSIAIGKSQSVDLLSTAWEADKFYWADPQNSAELIAALVYARRRELPVNLPVRLHRIRTNAASIRELKKHYHTLCMPTAAWTDPVFMNYLVAHKVPYARLPLSLGRLSIQTILLPRSHPRADTFGNGLLLAGARELSDFLLRST